MPACCCCCTMANGLAGKAVANTGASAAGGGLCITAGVAEAAPAMLLPACSP